MYFSPLLGFGWITSTGDPNSRGDFMYRFLGPWAQVDLCSYCHCLFPLWPLWLRRKVLILWGNTSVFHVEHCLWFSPQNALEKNSKWWIMLTLASFIKMYMLFYVLASNLAQIGIWICTPICQYLLNFLNVTYFGITPSFWAIRIATCCLQLHCSFFCFFSVPFWETFSIRLQVVNNLANSSKLQNRLVSPFVPLVFQIAKFTPTEPIFLWPRICHLQGQLLLWSHLEISRHYKTDMKEVWWNPSIAGSKHRILEPLVQVCWIFDYPRYMYSLNMPNLICSSEPEQVILNAFQRIGPDTLMGGLNC